MENNAFILKTLKEHIKPALGCTEPIAVAYAVSAAKDLLDGSVEKIEIIVDKNVFKNAMGVGIPGTDRKGLKTAAALALICGKSENKLEVLKDINVKHIYKAAELMEKDVINISTDKEINGLYIQVTAKNEKNSAKVIIMNKHDNIVLMQKNEEILFKNMPDSQEKRPTSEAFKKLSIADFVTFSNNTSLTNLNLVKHAIEMNRKLADAGIKEQSVIDYVFEDGKNNKVYYKEYAKKITYAACNARMTGYPLSVMSCAGSGNHGLMATLPIAAIGEVKNIDEEKIIRGVTLSLLVTIYVKAYTGLLSPICGCGVAAGLGASAGITYILGGKLTQIEGAVKNMVGGITGIICDGGKPGCAFKLAISTEAAIDAALMALNDIFISHNDGIIDKTTEQSIKNLGRVSTEGMTNTDETILDIMIKKCP